MAHDLIRNSKSRRTDNGPGEGEDGRSGRAGTGSGSSYEEISGASKQNIPHKTTVSHGGKIGKPTKASTKASTTQESRDTPTPPINVPHSERLARDGQSRRYRTENTDVTTSDGEDQAHSHDRPDEGGEGSEAEMAAASTGHKPPKLQVRTRPHSRSLLAQIAKEMSGHTPDASYTSRKERSAAMRVPSLASTVPEEAVDIPPLSESLKGSSPPIEDIPTPSERVCDSPLAVSPSQSPVSAASSWYSRKYGNRPSSVRRTSRRSGANSVSASPAAEFLRQYSTAPKTPEADSDGAAVGDYVLGRQVGSGGFSQVREAFTSASPSATPTLAVKIVRKQIKGQTEAENDTLQSQFEHELEVWRPLQHSNILQLHESIATQFATFAFMPLVAGGTLWDAVKATKGQGLDMFLAKKYAAQLAQALRYLHQDMHLIHRDIKLENCLLDAGYFQNDGNSRWGSSPDAYPRLLLADFGLAEYIPSAHPELSQESASTSPKKLSPDYAGPAGSLPYTAPEMLSTKKTPPLSPKIDIWAYGVLLFALVTGRMPFQNSFNPKLIELIKSGDFDRELLQSCIERGQTQCCRQAADTEDHSCRVSIFRNESWARSVRTIVPTEGIPVEGHCLTEVINACLNTKPHERWDIAQVVESSWLVSEVRDGDEDGLEMANR